MITVIYQTIYGFFISATEFDKLDQFEAESVIVAKFIIKHKETL